jgi:hypothetical protein
LQFYIQGIKKKTKKVRINVLIKAKTPYYSGFPYVVCLLAIWAAGGIAVPLCKYLKPLKKNLEILTVL